MDRILCASAFESKYRAWIITAVYLLSLACFRFDRRDIGFTVASALAGLIPVPVTARAFYFAAALLAFLAAYLRTWTSAYTPSSSAADTLYPRANGPYRFVRHPVYLGMVLLFLGFGLLLNPLGLTLLLAGMAALLYRLLLREKVERPVAGYTHYAQYCAKVPSLVPAFQPQLPPGKQMPDWRRATLREAYLWAFGVTLVVLAVTLREKPFYIALGLSLLIQTAGYFSRSKPV